MSGIDSDYWQDDASEIVAERGWAGRLAKAPMFASFQVREFRLLWLGLLFSFLGAWIQSTAMGWWVFDKADSPFLLSLVNASNALPMMVFSLIAGAAADRIDRRRLLIATRTIVLVLLLLLATLIALDMATVWHVMIISMVSGTAFAFDLPARQALVPELVGQHQLTNAMALNSAVWNGSQIVGPAIAGNLVGVIGTANCLYVAAIMYVGILIALFMMRVPKTVTISASGSVLESIAEGLHLVAGDHLLRMLIVFSAVYIVFGLPYAVFMPVFARDILDVGAQGLGLLLAAAGVGALFGAMGLAALSSSKYKGRLVLAGGITFTIALIIFCVSRWFPLSMLVLAVVGLTGSMTMTIVNVVLLQRVAPQYQGRIMSVLMVAWGIQPVGTMFLGGLANVVGTPVSIGIGASICLLFIIGLAARRSPVFRLS